MRLGGRDATDVRVEQLDRRRRSRNTRVLCWGMAAMAAAMVVPLLLAGVDWRVAAVTAGAALALGACGWMARKYDGEIAPVTLNVILEGILFAGVAVNRQIGPGPAFVGFSLFVAAATLPLRGVIAGGVLGAINVAAMCYVARAEPQLVERPTAALTYGLAICFVTTLLSVVQTITAHRALSQVVARQQRATAAEARALESESRYRLITDNTSGLVAVLDGRGRFVYASPSFERVLGTTPDELVQRPCFELTHPDDRARAIADFAEAFAHGKARGAYRCPDKAGRERWVEWVYDAVSGGDGAFVVVAAHDVTEHRVLTAQLQQAQKMEALGRMAAAVAHDFNNLLMVVGTAITVAQQELSELGQGWRALKDGELATSGATALTTRLLAFSRQIPIAAQVVDAREALGGVAQLLPRALGPQVALRVDLRGDLPPIMAAPVQLEQVLLNLALNARDAMPQGGQLSVVARARRLADGEEADCRPGEWLELSVSDTGVGMTEEVMAHLFEPFFTTKPAGQGTGLGLSTCYGIVRQLGGVIRARSEIRQGDDVRRPPAAGP